MKRVICCFVLLLILIFLPNSIFSQEERGVDFEQEQALNIAGQIANQKSFSVDNPLAGLGDDTSALIDAGYQAWTNLDFNQAITNFQKALTLEPNNREISELIYEAMQAKIDFQQKQAQIQKKILQEQRMLETDKAWLISEPDLVTKSKYEKKEFGTKKIKNLADAKKVSVDFSDAKLKDVFEYLSKTSGINIIMDENAVNSAGTISIHLKEITLSQALESMLRTKGLGYRFENDFIWISSSKNIKNEDLITRIYHLSQGLAAFTTFTTFDTVTVNDIRSDEGIAPGSKEDKNKDKKSSDSSSGGVRTYEGVKVGGSGGISGKITTTIEDVLKKIVSWPEGATIFLDNRTSTLIVRNTPSNLAIIEQALAVLDVNPPQVMIEARFVEVGADDLFSLGLKLNSEFSATGASSPTTYPFNKDQNTKYANAFPANSATDFSFGTLDFTQFQAVLSAIEENKDSNTLSSPKITTISGQEAVIKIVKEYRYPTKYDIQTFDKTVSGTTVTYYATVPAEFKTRDIGIILKVTPNVGADGKTINLTLVPEVSEFDINNDMYNYGTEETPYKQPFFNVRNCTASIVVNNNDTVVMGGLMREVVEHTVDRVPVLGQLPLLGTLFSRTYDNKQKRNLLIFVTAKIVAPTGETVAGE
ncbi:MAG: secretin and TonB N-terminal domain-containing protein [Candidatus Omnitrophota bacterium]